jgi:hypothetical protein
MQRRELVVVENYSGVWICGNANLATTEEMFKRLQHNKALFKV